MAESFFKIKNLWFSYQADQWILRNVSLDLEPGSMNMLMGSSGSGKTTLLKISAGLLPFKQGEIIKKKMTIGYIPQQLGLVRNLSVLENVMLGSLLRTRGLGALVGIFPKQEIELAKSLLAQLGLSHKTGERVIRLSGGERQRVAIARTLMQKPALVFADEFISDLDAGTASEILKLVGNLAKKEGAAFLMSIHHPEMVKDFDGMVFIMKDGVLTSTCRGSEISGMIREAVL